MRDPTTIKLISKLKYLLRYYATTNFLSRICIGHEIPCNSDMPLFSLCMICYTRLTANNMQVMINVTDEIPTLLDVDCSILTSGQMQHCHLLCTQIVWLMTRFWRSVYYLARDDAGTWKPLPRLRDKILHSMACMFTLLGDE